MIVMYNSERKQRFLEEEKLYNESTVLRVFKRAEIIEENEQKDICEWSASTILSFLKYLNTGSTNTLVVIRSLMTRYTQWCLQNNLTETGQNNWQVVTQDLLLECVNKNKNVVLTRREVLDICNQQLNTGDKFILLGLFEGICSYGKEWEEVANARLSDINLDTNVITLCTGRQLKISDELKNYAIEASKEEFIHTATKEYKVSPTEPSDLIVKTKNRKNADDASYRKGIRCFIRVNKMLKDEGIVATAANIENSGKIEFVNERASEADMTAEDWLSIKENEEEFIRRFNKYTKGRKSWIQENEQYLI